MHYNTRLHCSTLHYSVVKYTTLQYIALKCSIIQYIALQCSTLHYSTIQYIAYTVVHCTTPQYNTVQCSTLQYTALQCSTLQFTALQCTTHQYSTLPTLQYNTVHCTTIHYTSRCLVRTQKLILTHREISHMISGVEQRDSVWWNILVQIDDRAYSEYQNTTWLYKCNKISPFNTSNTTTDFLSIYWTKCK